MIYQLLFANDYGHCPSKTDYCGSSFRIRSLQLSMANLFVASKLDSLGEQNYYQSYIVYLKLTGAAKVEVIDYVTR